MRFLTLISLYSLAGILLGIGFIIPQLWPLGIVGVALQLGLLAQYSKYQVWGSYTAWLVKSLFAIGYFLTVYPIKWLPLEFTNNELGLVLLYWLTVSMFLAFGGAAFGLMYKSVSKIIAHSPWLLLLIPAPLWVVGEVIGSMSFSLFTLGPGGALNIHYNAGYIGLLLADHNMLLPIAKLGGVYILSFMTVVVAALLVYQIWPRPKKIKLLVSLGVLVLLWVTPSVFISTQSSNNVSTTVAVISTTFPVEEMFDRQQLTELIEKQENALAAAVETGAEYILLPEDARFINQTEDLNLAKNYFKFKHPESNALIIDSSRVRYEGQAVLQGLVFDGGSGQHAIAHKKYLVPQGEYVPYFYEGLFRLLGFDELLNQVTTLISYTVGPITSQAHFESHYPGILFCFESSSGTGVRQLVEERPDVPFIAHPVSHTWFNEPDSLWSQLERSLKIQSVWNDIAIVSATNHGPSQMFLPSGEVKEPEIVSTGEFWEVGLFSVPIKQ